MTLDRRELLLGVGTAAGMAARAATGSPAEHPAYHDRPAAVGDHRGALRMPHAESGQAGEVGAARSSASTRRRRSAVRRER